MKKSNWKTIKINQAVRELDELADVLDMAATEIRPNRNDIDTSRTPARSARRAIYDAAALLRKAARKFRDSEGIPS